MRPNSLARSFGKLNIIFLDISFMATYSSIELKGDADLDHIIKIANLLAISHENLLSVPYIAINIFSVDKDIPP